MATGPVVDTTATSSIFDETTGDQNGTNFTPQPVESYIEYKASIWVKVVWCLIIIPLGTVGNILSFIVMRSKEMRKSTTCHYLSILAISDSCVLYLAALPEMTFSIMGVQRYDYNLFTCTVLNYAEFVTTDISSWILVAVSFERLLSAWFPFHAKQICSVRIAYIVCLIVTVMLASVNTQLLFLKGIVDGICQPLKHYEWFWNNVWLWWDMCNFSLVPMSLISTCNILVLVKLKLNSRWQQTVKSGTAQGGKKKISSNTIIMMSVNVAFFTSTFPSVLFQVLVPGWYATSGRLRARYELAWAFLLMLSFTNSAINFILYCLSGPRFRRELTNILGIARKSSTVRPAQESATFQSRNPNMTSDTRPPTTVSGQEVDVIKEE